MSTLPIDEAWQADDFDREPTGTYWTPPVPVSIHELHPTLRAAVSLAIEARSEGLDQFEIHLAHAFDMDSGAPVGSFVVSTDEAGGRAFGIYSEGGDVGVKEPMWFAFGGDTDYAFKSLYDRCKEEGYLA
ncbi:hypothetical protein FHT72_006515 [Rhizobium sp. BK077]|uniref:hypothetical protein n=1 Tax=unclassified Rhizobium TaxID=2613769 RepID=UPI00161EAFF2|nr:MULTISPECIES: hypothetical protein [unclassified Rhizobium]MBB3303090.1 hypothetical protein [Rhizobium sp. BK112]MBB3371983.1 hypothetical protein [Rhizobium sp. BK077]MBB4182949.1 hypothetical protein [Rhizobium sp. BK109]